MQTHFSSEQLGDPKIKEANDILRKCVHCGFCTATCPTFVQTGDERDSPRGRIWLMRELLESPETVSKDTRHHLDRCLGCQSCMTTCPSGVDYIRLLDIGREKMDMAAPRGFGDTLIRRMLGMIIPYAGRFHLMMRFAGLGRLFAPRCAHLGISCCLLGHFNRGSCRNFVTTTFVGPPTIAEGIENPYLFPEIQTVFDVVFLLLLFFPVGRNLFFQLKVLPNREKE